MQVYILGGCTDCSDQCFLQLLAADMAFARQYHPHRGDRSALCGRKRGKRIERAQGRQRVFLALALLTQVVLQWAWGVVLFVSPSYGQKNCSGDTKLRFFLVTFTAHEINERYMFVWVLWLLFSLGITMFMTIVLALTSPTRARSTTERRRS